MRERREAAREEGTELSVLLVDDDPLLVRMLERTLGRDGFRMRSAGGGEGALREIGAAPTDVVLLDVHLAGENGIDLIGRFRAAGFKGAVIVFSGDASFATAHAAARAGADGYLLKVEFDRLPELLRCLERRRPDVAPEPIPEAAAAYLATRGVTDWELALVRELAAGGETEKAIARNTGRSETAVRKGFESIRRKIGANGQPELARMLGVLSCFGGRR